MQKITPEKRIMQDEFAARGILTDTGEIRMTYDLMTLRSNLTFIPQNETQKIHKHILVSEAIHVLAGQIQVLLEGLWENITENQVALFDLNEFHCIRTINKKNSVLYTGANSNTAAVAIVYKWIPPFLDIHEDEVTFVIKNDWFSSENQINANNAKDVPLSLLKRAEQEKFWQIVKRNRFHLH